VTRESLGRIYFPCEAAIRTGAKSIELPRFSEPWEQQKSKDIGRASLTGSICERAIFRLVRDEGDRRVTHFPASETIALGGS